MNEHSEDGPSIGAVNERGLARIGDPGILLKENRLECRSAMVVAAVRRRTLNAKPASVPTIVT
jgi:hypothetical protein